MCVVESAAARYAGCPSGGGIWGGCLLEVEVSPLQLLSRVGWKAFLVGSFSLMQALSKCCGDDVLAFVWGGWGGLLPFWWGDVPPCFSPPLWV